MYGIQKVILCQIKTHINNTLMCWNIQWGCEYWLRNFLLLDCPELEWLKVSGNQVLIWIPQTLFTVTWLKWCKKCQNSDPIFDCIWICDQIRIHLNSELVKVRVFSMSGFRILVVLSLRFKTFLVGA